MRQIKYSPDAADKLRALKRTMVTRYGAEKARQIISAITKAIQRLAVNEKIGPAVEDMFGVQTDYRYLYISKNYVFYRVESQYIYVDNIYNEKEDFMWQVFGIDTTLQDTLDYWKE